MPESLDLAALAFTFVVIGCAAAIKAAIGFGFPLIAVPILSNVMDPRTAIVMMSVPVMLSNFMMIFACRGSGALARRVVAVLGALVIGTFLGAQMLASLDLRAISVMVGVTAIVFAALRALRVNLVVPAKRERGLSILFGLVAGLLGGATNIHGPVLAAYLQSLRLSKSDFVFAITLLFVVANGTQVLSLLQLGLYTPSVMLLAVFACVPMVLGVVAGLRLQRSLTARVWNALVLVVIFLSGANLLVRGLLG
jgi:uncharacterized membrane protein YfcA